MAGGRGAPNPVGQNIGGMSGAPPGGGGAQWLPIAINAGTQLGSAAINAYGQNKASQQSAALQENAVTYLYDPTNPVLKPVVGGTANYLQNFLGDVGAGQNPFGAYTSSLERLGTTGLQQLGGTQSEGSKAYGMLSPTLQNFITQNAQAPQTVAFQPAANPFTQALANPFAGTQGFENPGQNVVDAYMPVWEQALQRANAQLSSSAASPFSTAFTQQGIDLGQNALKDFNLFAGQQLAAGEQLRAQQQQAAQQFLLGSRGLAQDALQGQNAIGLQAHTAGQQADLANRDLASRNFLGGTSELGQGALALDDANLQRLLGIFGAGLQGSAGAINPILQVLSQIFQYGTPSDLNAVVGGKGPQGGVFNPGGSYGAPTDAGGNVYVPGHTPGSRVPLDGRPLPPPEILRRFRPLPV